MPIFKDASLSIGNTPLIHLARIGKDAKATILGKAEGRNPSYSVKCRIGANMIWDAEERGILKPGGTIIEPTSGNTGIALAYVAAARGYRLILTMPEVYSIERRMLLKAFGAELVLTPGEAGMRGAITAAENLLAETPGAFMPQQFANPANPAVHVKTTGPEIWEDTGGDVDVFVAGVGTGGTITGVSRFFKEVKGKAIESIAVEPETSAVLSGNNPGPHDIQGIGAGFKPDNLDMALVDRIETVSDAEAYEYARRLAREEGLLCGISCGAAVAVCHRLAKQPEYEGKTIVTVLPDIGERYLSTKLFDF